MNGSSALIVSLLLATVSFVPDGSERAHHATRTASSAALVGIPRIRFPRLRLPHRHKVAAEDTPMALVHRRLHLLVGQEERYYADNGRYGKDVAAVSRTNAAGDSLVMQVNVQVLYANDKGWTAMASHPDAPGKSCVVFVGYRERLPLVPRTRTDAATATDEGRPTCDR